MSRLHKDWVRVQLSTRVNSTDEGPIAWKGVSVDIFLNSIDNWEAVLPLYQQKMTVAIKKALEEEIYAKRRLIKAAHRRAMVKIQEIHL